MNNLPSNKAFHSSRFLPVAGILIVFLIWLIATELGLASNIFLPSPLEVASVLNAEIVVSHEWHVDIFYTLVRALASLLIGGIIGVLIGIALGSFDTLYRTLEGLLDFFRGIPATALFPLFVIVLGIGDASKVAVASWVVALLVTLNTSYGIRHGNRVRLLAARMLKPSFKKYWFEVVLPEAASQVLSGLRLGLNFALAVVVVTEMFIGTTHGIGYRIINAQLTYSIPEIYAGILVLGVMGYLLNRTFVVLEKRIVHWVGK